MRALHINCYHVLNGLRRNITTIESSPLLDIIIELTSLVLLFFEGLLDLSRLGGESWPIRSSDLFFLPDFGIFVKALSFIN